MSDALPRICPNCGFNRWRTSRLARVALPSGTKDRELVAEVIEVNEPVPVCLTCEAAARRQRRPLTGRVLERTRDADPDAGRSNSPAGQLPPI